MTNVDPREIKQNLQDKKLCGFNVLMMITCTDLPENLELTYVLTSFDEPKENNMSIVKVLLPKDKPEIESVVEIFPSANFEEREIYDLFGVKFISHPNLTRLYMPEDWHGHPMLKGYVSTDTRLKYNE